MSVKEFFAFSNIKQTVLEFLKIKADFENLSDKFKKPFRAHINKHQGSQGVQKGSVNQIHTVPVAENGNDGDLTDYFVSDGFNSIKCHFSEVCRKKFEETYPTSLHISNTVNMLLCVQNYQVELRASNANAKGSDFHSLKNLEVVLVIDELRVISFDRFGMKMPSSVAFDDQVRAHLSFLRHFLMKQVLIP